MFYHVSTDFNSWVKYFDGALLTLNPISCAPDVEELLLIRISSFAYAASWVDFKSSVLLLSMGTVLVTCCRTILKRVRSKSSLA